MRYSVDRRTFGAALLGSIATGSYARLPSKPFSTTIRGSQISRDLRALEVGGGGRLGVMAVDTGSGATITYRADERFPMCSTHKVVVAAAILSLVEKGQIRADQRVAYNRADMLEYAPVTQKNLAAGFMTVDALCEAAVRWSDNTADNLLLKLLGGPAGWTRYARSIGDTVSRLDRIEPEMNSSIPGDPRDTSSPRAMTGTLTTLLLGHALNNSSRAKLKSWMLDSPITGNLLRQGLPADWHVADKSGSGPKGSRNDVGVLYPPRSAPIIMSVFYTGSRKSITDREAVITRCAGLVGRNFRAA